MAKEIVELGKLVITITSDHQQTRYSLEGQLSESFDQRQIPPSQVSMVVFDMAGIEYVSSVGIREWVLLINHWSKKHTIYYERCSIYFVDQINMVPDCLGSAKVRSVYAPYYRDCDKCSGEKTFLMEFGSSPPSLDALKIPGFQCGDCSQDLEFDALDESYFSFLKYM